MVTKLEQPSLLVQRVTEFNFKVLTKVEFSPDENEEAGLVAIYNNLSNFRLVKTSENGKNIIKLYKVWKGEESVVAVKEVGEEALILGLRASGLEYQFVYGSDEKDLQNIGEVQDATVSASQSGIDFT